jgi:hypothetical protein
MVFLFSVRSNVKSQHQVNGTLVTLLESKDNTFTVKTDTFEVKFNPTEFFWNVQIKNNLNSDVSVIWNKSSFVLNNKSSKIIFDETPLMQLNESIPNEEITNNSYIEKIFILQKTWNSLHQPSQNAL